MKQLFFLLLFSVLVFSSCKKEVAAGNFCDCIVTGGEAVSRGTATDYFLYLDCGKRNESVKVTEGDFREAKVYQKIKTGICANE